MGQTALSTALRVPVTGVPEALFAADDALLSTVPMAAMHDQHQPGLMRAQAGLVMLAHGERDLSVSFHNEPSGSLASRDASRFRLPGSGPCHHLAPTRHGLWQRLALWGQMQAQCASAKERDHV